MNLPGDLSGNEHAERSDNAGNLAVAEQTLVRILAQREAELREAQRIAGVGSWTWDIESDLVQWSEAHFTIFGLEPASEAPGFADQAGLYAADSWIRLGHAIERCRSSAEAYELRLEIRHPGGGPRWIDGRGEPIRDSAGRITGLRGTVHDVTRIVTAEQALERSRQALAHQLAEIEQVYRDSPVGLFTFDRDFRFLRINELMAEINGLPAPAHIGRTMREVIPHMADHLEQVMRPVLDHGQTVLGLEVKGRTPKAPEIDRDWLVNYFPMRDPGGEIIGLFGAVQEITDRKRAEESLLRSEKRFRQLFDHAPIGKAIVSLEGHFEQVNPALCAITGYDREELMALDFQAITDPDDLDQDLRLVSDLAAGRIPSYQLEKRYRRKDGTTIWAQLNVSLLRNDDGQPLHFLSQIQDISARKLLEQDLRTERDRLRTVFDAAPSAILTVDQTGRIESANDRAEAVFGYTRAELEGLSVEQLIPSSQAPDHRSLRDDYFKSDVPSGLMSGRPIRGLHRDGRLVPLEIRLSRYQDSTGLKVIAVATDRSEQELLSESELRWRTVANSLPQLVWTCTADGQCDFLSRQWTAYTGISATSQLGSGWLQQVHPEDQAPLAARWKAAVTSASEFHTEFRVRRHDGSYRWFDTRAIPLKDDKGQVSKWIGSNTDVEDRRRAEARAQDLNQHLEQRITERTQLLDAARRDLRNILDALPSMVGYWDREQRNRFANHAYLDWFGLPPEAVTGRLMSDVLGPRLYALNREHVEAALRGEPQSFERQIPGPDGTIRYSLARYIPDLLDGEVRGFYALVHDVTDVRRAQAAAEAASAAKSTFLANMSHEIRTPMNAVLGLLKLLLQTPLDPTQKDYADKGVSAARTLLGILNDVLDFSKIEAGKLSLDLHPFSLDELLRELAVLLAAARGGKPIDLLFEVDPAIPDALVGDSLRLKQILLNLAGNALKFTERGEVVVAVKAWPQASGQVSLSFSVRDTGIGMSEAQCRKVFEGFVQAEAATTRHYGGTGLGLAISQRLALLMGGELSVTSRPGAGSVFCFTVTLEGANRERPKPNLCGLRVLLVDDHAPTLAAAAMALQAYGAEVSAHRDLDAALAARQDLRTSGSDFDVAVVDWPPASPSAAAAAAGLDLPVVALTSEIGPLTDMASRGSASCARVKPVTGPMLAEAITEARQRDPRLAPVAPTRKRLAGIRVLLVEDNALNQFVAQNLLAGEGAQVSLATDGASGVAAVRATHPPFDVVLMDVQMPEMDGHTATRQIRALPAAQHLPIIAMTANVLDADREACLQSGMNDHVGKPIDLDHLVGAILRWCGQAPAGAPEPAVAAPVPPRVLNRAAALQRLSGNEAMYREVAASFSREASSLFARLGDADPEVRRRAAHTLRSLAATLGAEQLAKAVREAEPALAQSAGTGHRLEAGRRIAIALAEADRAITAAAASISPGGPAAGPSAEATGGWDELERLLESWQGDALSVFTALRERDHRTDPALLQRIGAAVEALDFTTARALCRERRTSLIRHP